MSGNSERVSIKRVKRKDICYGPIFDLDLETIEDCYRRLYSFDIREIGCAICLITMLEKGVISKEEFDRMRVESKEDRVGEYEWER